ncbi:MULTISPECIES: hypothetical protein [Vibrio harveyi group]|uniref:Uncharacterized protein n=1 Tax=Vibrio owensii CAIM 1854 = LMG 25443 TaxID=1229493 RepID=A0A0C1VU77_9VIBR|nr:hypothetical protein [Vibrio owensii]KIF53428.1 hypothetical protein H735_10980 [Vibrio owensii CAIM 1854 = LMG 25443]
MSNINKVKKQKSTQVKNHNVMKKLAKQQKKKCNRKVNKDSVNNSPSKKIAQSACNLVIANAVGLSGVGLYGILTQVGAMDIHVALFVIGQIVSVIASGVHVYFDVAYKDSG